MGTLQAGAASLFSPLVGFTSTLHCTHHTAAASHCSPLRVHPSLGAASLVISPLVGFGCTPAWRGFTTLMRLQFASGKSTWPGFTTLLANAAVFFDRDTPA